jgi:hypothetical protein
MRVINLNGITSSISPISRNVCEKNRWYVDMLENGNWMVSEHNTTVGLFSSLEEAMFFFMAKSEPMEPLTEEQISEAMEWLEEMIK